MPEITKPQVREIIGDFSKEIRERKIWTAKPSKHIINFRSERADNFERDVVRVPIGLLRFRKDNGRISSDVFDYENTHGILNERDENAQEKLREFLEKKDPEKTDILLKSIQHDGQQDPAIITCDGFLINGNRRKMVMEKLHDNEYFATMKVVILPGQKDPGGPPTLLEIEKLENRYQLQSEGKSEYYGFDRALSIRRKIEIGLSLMDQISDDPQYANANKVEKNRAVKKLEKDFLNPLECIDRYLKQFKREKQYSTISTGMADKEGRWEAFKDYSNIYHTKFKSSKYLMENGVEEREIGDIETAAFNVIRLRNIPDMPKVHQIMRDFHRYCGNREAKKEILNIPKKVKPELPEDEYYENGDRKKPLSGQQIDDKWETESKQDIIFHLRRASNIYQNQKQKETPIDLLEAALNKLKHENMDLRSIRVNDYESARELVVEIKEEAQGLEKQIYEQYKNIKKLQRKSK